MMRNMSITLHLAILLALYLSNVCSVFHVLLGGTLLRRRVRYRSEVTDYVDKLGEDESIKDAIKAAGLGTSIAVFRTSDNDTVAALLSDAEQKMLVPVGAQVLKTLYPHLHVLVTGFSGDCRSIVRQARQIVSNHTMEYGIAPTGRYLSVQMAEYMQSFVGNRAVAAKLFVIHTPTNRTSSIYELDSWGLVHRVSAGLAGKEHKAAYAVLEGYYNGDNTDGKEGGYINVTDVSKCLQEMWSRQIHAERPEERKVARLFRLLDRAHLAPDLVQPTPTAAARAEKPVEDIRSHWDDTHVQADGGMHFPHATDADEKR